MAHTHDYAEANRQHYNQNAHSYDAIEFAHALAAKSGKKMLSAYAFDPETTRVMDYACGTGLLSQALAAYAKTIVGVDLSQGMVDQYNKRVSDQGIPPEEMRAICVELKGEPGELDGLKFDVIVCSQAYHHFSSIEDVTRLLTTFLKPGGTLLVVDLVKSEQTLRQHTSHDAPDHVKHTVAHKGGFVEEEIRPAFDGAGLNDFSFDPTIDVQKNGKVYQLFLAKGTKSSDEV